MTGKELILNVVNRKSSGGILPVYFSFAEKKAEYRFAQYMGMTSNELREWMRNDLVSIYPVEDVQFLSMTGGSFELAKELGFAKGSPLPNAMTDRFGCTWSIDCIGQELRKGCVEDIEDIYSFSFPSPDHPDSLYGIREQIEELAVDLNAKERQLLDWLLEGYQLTEIAHMWGITYSAVKKKKQRMIEKMKARTKGDRKP